MDDYAPGATQQEANKLAAKAETLFRSVGNQAGRGRRNSDMTDKPAYFPRGLMVATGEDLPRGVSLRGRMLIIEMNRNDVDLQTLSLLQDFARQGRLAQAMANFIQWLAPRIGDLKKSFSVSVRDLRDARLKQFAGAHSRAPELFANLFAAADLLIDFLHESGAINEARAAELADQIDENLEKVLGLQGCHQNESDEVLRFIAILRACFSSGEVHVGDHLTNSPPKLKTWAMGWRAKESDGDLVGCGALIGWVNVLKNEIWLEPEPTFKAVQRFAASQGEPILMNKSTLWRRALDRGLLLHPEQNYKTSAIRPDPKRGVVGRSVRVLIMDIEKVINSDEN